MGMGLPGFLGLSVKCRQSHHYSNLEYKQRHSLYYETRMPTKPFVDQQHSNAHKDFIATISIVRLFSRMEILYVQIGLSFIIKRSSSLSSIQPAFQDADAHSSWTYKYRLSLRHYSPFLSRPFFN